MASSLQTVRLGIKQGLQFLEAFECRLRLFIHGSYVYAGIQYINGGVVLLLKD
jgi:hypothetical protein